MDSRPVLILGATGMLGRPVVQYLISQGRPVRTLVRNVEAAPRLLGDSVEIIEAVWKTLADKEVLCEALESALVAGTGSDSPEAWQERWGALPELPSAWEKKMLARRDAALAALADPAAAGRHRQRIESSAQARREALLELEMAFGLESPADLQPQRLALQVKMLKERFGGGAAALSASDRLLGWCAQPGVIDGRDGERRDRLFAAMGQAR